MAGVNHHGLALESTRVEWNGMKWNGMEFSGMERNGVEWNKHQKYFDIQIWLDQILEMSLGS